MTTSSVVAALMLHNQSCSQCRMGEPCVVTERILDEWLHRQAAAQVEASTSAWPAEDAA
ncbi:MAG TPA: hypothetical protein VMA74_06090 [Dyella sp.]|uniref:hypothetical protein n=1 Tax=Dyella sp. TaxID=1869338 RepID=UPI002BB70C3C|nr:hypothetical protein [Dyella sp.]HUB89284.1 hypothetical protein [Dyella sp.]